MRRGPLIAGMPTLPIVAFLYAAGLMVIVALGWLGLSGYGDYWLLFALFLAFFWLFSILFVTFALWRNRGREPRQ